MPGDSRNPDRNISNRLKRETGGRVFSLQMVGEGDWLGGSGWIRGSNGRECDRKWWSSVPGPDGECKIEQAETVPERQEPSPSLISKCSRQVGEEPRKEDSYPLQGRLTDG